MKRRLLFFARMVPLILLISLSFLGRSMASEFEYMGFDCMGNQCKGGLVEKGKKDDIMRLWVDRAPSFETKLRIYSAYLESLGIEVRQ